MALTIDASASSKVGIEDYIEFLDDNLDSDDLDQVCAHADTFAALLNNETLMSSALNRELARWRDFQNSNHYSAQTFLLGRAKQFVIRANVWTPPSSPDGEMREWEDKFYYYRVPHDHNFSFMTGGYYGSGYATTIYEYDPKKVVGEPGEAVDMTFVEKTRLPKGKIMVYRASKDIHSQEHPEEFSISVNLLLIRPEDTLATQYQFDLETKTIAAPLQNTSAAQEMLCDLARHVGDSRTEALLDDLYRSHPNPRFRFASLSALSDLSQSCKVLERGLQDAHPFVRQNAKAVLESTR